MRQPSAPTTPNVATAVNNLGNVLQDLGDLQGARAAAERALGIVEATLGPDHPNTRLVRENLAALEREA
ncbi:MAG: tetratricopeptide repeat protein [Thermoanaerobaculia bacterium]